MQIIKQLDNIQELIQYINNLPLKNDPSSYSKGRLICWINKEPLLYIKRNCYALAKEAVEDEYINQLCNDLFEFKVDYILVSYSGSFGCGIDWHRDASFSASLAGTINLGKCKFGSIFNKKEEWLDLIGGEVITFNSKQLHCVIPEPNRWAIHCWQDSGK